MLDQFSVGTESKYNTMDREKKITICCKIRVQYERLQSYKQDSLHIQRSLCNGG